MKMYKWPFFFKYCCLLFWNNLSYRYRTIWAWNWIASCVHADVTTKTACFRPHKHMINLPQPSACRLIKCQHATTHFPRAIYQMRAQVLFVPIATRVFLPSLSLFRVIQLSRPKRTVSGFHPCATSKLLIDFFKTQLQSVCKCQTKGVRDRFPKVCWYWLSASWLTNQKKHFESVKRNSG